MKPLPTIQHAQPLALSSRGVPEGLDIETLSPLRRRDAIVEVITSLGGVEHRPFIWEVAGIRCARNPGSGETGWRYLKMGGLDGRIHDLDRGAPVIHVSPQGAVIYQTSAVTMGKSLRWLPVNSLEELVSLVETLCPHGRDIF
ncbi:MAG: hypothetical protein ACQEXG_14890 [Pseudomonadota bacterium]